MANAKDNELLTNCAAGTPTGDLLRAYWQPAALAAELEGPRPLVPVRLLGEDLVLFRDDHGRLGLLGRRCSHRGVDLCFGRLENGGLRCPFHGWLYDVHGQCLEQPAEPKESTAYRRLVHRSYRCEEHGGIIFAYLGPGTPPAFPAFDCFVAPPEHTFAFKGLWACNWLQALEVGIDPAHASYLHRFAEDESRDRSYGQQFRADAADTGLPLTKILREHPRPTIRVEDTNFGFRLVTTRALDQRSTHYRITNLVFPNAIAIPMSNDMIITQWHVPIDNVSCYWYSIFTSFKSAVDRETMRQQRLQNHTLPDYRPKLNRDNNWGFNSAEQQSQTFTGMGMDINVHDQWAVESPGPIFDRTQEHLGKSDVGIIRYRKLLHEGIQAVQAEETPAFVFDPSQASQVNGPIALDAIGPTEHDTCWQSQDRERRAMSSWAAPASRG
jgi:phthalate 4,5-dioxygenase